MTDTKTDTRKVRATFERIGRARPGPLDIDTTWEAGVTDITEAIYDYARRHLNSAGYSVVVTLDDTDRDKPITGAGSIEAGRYGRFTITEVTP